jgi:LysM repeat protein
LISNFVKVAFNKAINYSNKQSTIRSIGMAVQSSNQVSNGENHSLKTNNQIESIKYTIKQGDTLGEIALKNGTTVDKLLQLNSQITNKNLIYMGDRLNIPASQSYTVQQGDTLSKISSLYGVSVDDLVRANNIANPDLIYPGDKVIIPNKISSQGSSSRSESINSATTSGDNSGANITPGKLPDTSQLSEAKKYDLYSNIINQHGSEKAKQQLANGEKVALSLRVPTNTRANAGNGTYDDRMVLVWKDSKGGKHVRECQANLDPSGQYEHKGPYGRKSIGADINGDGRLDQGRLAEGTYSFQRGSYRGKDAFLSSVDQVAERDADHNGRFDDNKQSPRGNYGMHIHIGGKHNTYSAGCLTMSPSEHKKFFNAVGNKRQLTNVIVDTQQLKASNGLSSGAHSEEASVGKMMTHKDWQRAANSLGVDVAAIKAVAKVEAAGKGFLSNGSPVILFEAHQFSRLTTGRYDGTHPGISSPKWNRSLYQGGAAEHTRLREAAALDETAALKSASWGKFQIMGFNYKSAGYNSVRDFVKAAYL